MQRFLNKNVVIVGAGQTPGSYIGNGRRTAMEFANIYYRKTSRTRQRNCF